MKKTFYQMRLLFFMFGFIDLLFFIGGLYCLIYDLSIANYTDIIKYAFAFAFAISIFGVYTVHYGKGHIAVTNKEISWTKEIFVPSSILINKWYEHLKYFWFSTNSSPQLISTNIAERFLLSDISEYGLINDFSNQEVSIEEKVPFTMVTNQVLVFKMKNDCIFYIRVKCYSKQKIRNFISTVQKLTGINPRDMLRSI